MRRKGLKELHTLGKILGGTKKPSPNIHIRYGGGRENMGVEQEDQSSPSMKSWVFSEKPFFQRYQPSLKKRIEIQKIKDPQTQVFKEVNEIRVVIKFPGRVEKEIDVKIFDDILSI